MKKSVKKNAKKIAILMLILVIIASVGAYATTYVLTAQNVTFVTPGGGRIAVKEALDTLFANRDKLGDNSDLDIEYQAGDIVYVGDEEFYVLYDSLRSSDTVTLFAKTNLNQEATAQANSVTTCAFSSSQYWSGTKLNLNTEHGNTETDAIGKARSYAKAKGAIEGRLLTYEEANSLKDSYGNMIGGTENYWIGSTDESTNSQVYYLNGNTKTLSSLSYNDNNTCGVRPVITVPKWIRWQLWAVDVKYSYPSRGVNNVQEAIDDLYNRLN